MKKSIESGSLRPRAVAALRECLLAASAVDLDEQGYTRTWRDNLLASVDPIDFEMDLRQGSGGELDTKFRAPHSSSALAVNTFAPFRRAPECLRVAEHVGFTSLSFERKCPSGLPGTPPNLDVLLEDPARVLAIESKCLEYLTPKKANFSSSYFSGIQDERRSTSWFSEMTRLRDTPDAYLCLDAAQLIKHALGLSHSFPGREISLLYLWWEPANAADFLVFSRHRDEVHDFAGRVAGSHIRFEWTAYKGLWDQWLAEDGDKEHVANLRNRYLVEL
jgi:hypothetical protein